MPSSTPAPQRHMTVVPPPRILKVPQEIVDMIHEHIADKNWVADVRSLRLVCKSLADRLLPHYGEGCFAPEVGRERKFIFYLDDVGVKDIERLANSNLAPYVQLVQLADRVVSPHFLKFAQTEDAVTSDQVTENMAAVIRHPPKPYSNGNDTPMQIEPYLANKCSRSRRQRAAYDTRCRESTVSWDTHGCEVIRDIDLRTSDASLSRLAQALTTFDNLIKITSDKSYVVNAFAIDARGGMAGNTTFHGGREWFDARDGVVECTCGSKDVLHVSKGCCLMTEDIVWPAAADLGPLVSFLPATLPLFAKLTALNLNFYENVPMIHANDLMQKHTSNIAAFIARCAALEESSISTLKGWDGVNAAHKLCPEVHKIVLALSKTNVRFPRLARLEFDHIDAVNVSTIDSFARHSATLERVDLRGCVTLADGDVTPKYADLFRVMSMATNLKHMDMYFLKDCPPKTRREETLRKAIEWLHSASLCGEARAWLRTIAAELKYWDGGLKIVLKARAGY